MKDLLRKEPILILASVVTILTWLGVPSPIHLSLPHIAISLRQEPSLAPHTPTSSNTSQEKQFSGMRDEPTTDADPNQHQFTRGEIWRLHSGVWWMCSGDFTMAARVGPVIPLYDPRPGVTQTGTTIPAKKIGLVVVVEPNSDLALGTPEGGGYCQSSSVKPNGAVMDAKLKRMRQADNCQNGCIAVNVKEIDRDGVIQKDYWQ